MMRLTLHSTRPLSAPCEDPAPWCTATVHMYGAHSVIHTKSTQDRKSSHTQVDHIAVLHLYRTAPVDRRRV